MEEMEIHEEVSVTKIGGPNYLVTGVTYAWRRHHEYIGVVQDSDVATVI